MYSPDSQSSGSPYGGLQMYSKLAVTTSGLVYKLVMVSPENMEGAELTTDTSSSGSE
jgi:hypothetical protein